MTTHCSNQAPRQHSTAGFHGGHVAGAMDALRTAVASVADLLDRQLALLVDEKFNCGLTPNEPLGLRRIIPWRESSTASKACKSWHRH